jgi:hypothetical protein
LKIIPTHTLLVCRSSEHANATAKLTLHVVVHSTPARVQSVASLNHPSTYVA